MGGMVMTVKFRQRGNFDCKLAVLATALQIDYDTLWPQEFRAKVEAKGGCYDELVKEAWDLTGLIPNVHYFETAVLTKFSHPAFIHRFLEHFGAARVLLQVPSLNDPGKAHLIFYQGGELFDPSNRKRYETVADLTEIQWVTVFDEKLVD